MTIDRHLGKDVRLTKPNKRGKRWRRQYALRPGKGLYAARGTFISQDAPMSDPQVQRFWLRVDMLLCAIAVIVLALVLVTVVP